MDLTDIKAGLASGDLVLEKNKLYTREEWEQIAKADHFVQHFELLQLTKKIQL